MKYHCTGCSYIYDELAWDEDLNITPKTYFESLPSDFFCPLCDTHKDDFTILSESIQVPLSLEKLTPKESEHIPFFEIKWDTLFFEIDESTHPNTQDHFIYKISLFDENEEEVESKIFEIWDEYKGSFDIEYMDEYELRIYCNQDWVFSSGLIERD